MERPEEKGKKIRVLISKIGLDAHDRGAKFVAQGLVGAGMEVIYLGSFHTPEGIVQAAVQEAVDVIGLSALSGECLYYLPRLMGLLQEKGAGEIPVILGGLIPREDEERLKEMGVKKIFHPGSTLKEIIAGIGEVVGKGGVLLR